MAKRLYQHTVIYQFETKEALAELAAWLIADDAWFAATPSDLTLETSKIRTPPQHRNGPPMRGVRLIEPRQD